MTRSCQGDLDDLAGLASRADKRPQIMMRFVRRLAHFEHHYVTALPAPTEVRHMIEIRKGNGVRHWSPPLLSAYSRKVGGDKPNLCDKSARTSSIALQGATFDASWCYRTISIIK